MNLNKELLTTSIVNLKRLTKKKIFKYQLNNEVLGPISEYQLIEKIRNNEFNGDTLITSHELKEYFMIKDTMYVYYLEEKNEGKIN